jgi:hypothetical protein
MPCIADPKSHRNARNELKHDMSDQRNAKTDSGNGSYPKQCCVDIHWFKIPLVSAVG